MEPHPRPDGSAIQRPLGRLQRQLLSGPRHHRPSPHDRHSHLRRRTVLQPSERRPGRLPEDPRKHPDVPNADAVHTVVVQQHPEQGLPCACGTYAEHHPGMERLVRLPADLSGRQPLRFGSQEPLSGCHHQLLLARLAPAGAGRIRLAVAADGRERRPEQRQLLHRQPDEQPRRASRGTLQFAVQKPAPRRFRTRHLQPCPAG